MSIDIRMPVANQICMPGRRVYFPALDDIDRETNTIRQCEYATSETFRMKTLEKCKLVDFGTASPDSDITKFLKRIEMDGDNQFQAELREQIGPQRLPFDRLWLEGKWPGNWEDGCGLTDMAIRMTSERRIDATPEQGKTAYSASIFTTIPDGSIVRNPCNVMVSVDKDGSVEYAGVSAVDPTTGAYTRTVEDGDMRIGALASVMPAMWAIGLMNCRNVTLAEVVPQARMTRRQRRPRPVGPSYSTIVLPNFSRNGSSGADTDDRGNIARHMVRGHFATYTSDAPMFGRYTGTYWRPWHVRGNADIGEVISSYKLRLEQ